MSAFGGIILTNRGLILQSKTQAGNRLNFTRIALGDGYLGTSSILALNKLQNEVKSLPIKNLRILNEGRVSIGTVLTNQELTSGFHFREIGVFATDPDVGEILYCYGNAGNLADYIPASGSDIIEKNIELQTVVGNAANITAVIDSSLVLETVEQAEERALQTEQKAKDYTDNQVLNKVDKIAGKGLSTNDFTTAEKDKLTNIAAGAEVNQNAFANVKVGTTTMAADSKTDTFEIVAGTNIEITPDATNDKITISISNATTSQKGAVQLNDTLTSTSTTQALTAAQGKALKEQVDNKVEKVAGKGLSTNDYTTAEKEKLGAVPVPAEIETKLEAQKKADAAKTAAIDWAKGFGLGTTSKLFSGDLNTLTENGFYYAQTAATNKPSAGLGFLMVQALNASYSVQTYFVVGTGVMYTRANNNGTWSAWTQQETTAGAQAKADAVNTALTNHKNDKANPHGVTKGQIGLGNVDNTSDVNKPISTAVQNALNTKANSTDLTLLSGTVTEHMEDNEYQTPVINGSQIQLIRKSNTSILKFRLAADIEGPISISLDGGETSKPLNDIEGVQLTELEKGFVEVVADANFFTLRNRGGGLSSTDLTNGINAVNTLIQM